MTGARLFLMAMAIVALAACAPQTAPPDPPADVPSPLAATATPIDPEPTVAAPRGTQIALLPAYPDTPLLGPDKAKGAVIYNHGLDYDEDPDGEPAFFLDRVRDAGWDVFTLLRPLFEDRDDHGPAILEEKARALRKMGYHRIVSAGQSYGAWISIEVAAHPGVLDAIVGAAPAYYGNVPPASYYNNNIVDIAAKMAPTPTLLFLFQKDDFDPGGRGEGFKKVLAKKGAAYAVIDRPAGFFGHSVAMSTAFSLAYAPCIIDFIDHTPPPGPYACTPNRPSAAEITARFRTVDRDTAIAHGVASPFLGQWYGWYQGGGRETLLSVEHVAADGRADGTYAFGIAHHSETGGAYAVTGSVADGVLHISTPHSELDCTILADGRMHVRWTTVSGTGETTLRKLAETDPAG